MAAPQLHMDAAHARRSQRKEGLDKIRTNLDPSWFERRSQRNFKSLCQRLCRDFSFVLKYNSKLSARVSAVQLVYFEHQYPESGNF